MKYCPRTAAVMPHIQRILRFPTSLKDDPNFSEIFGNRKSPIIGWRRDKNLKDVLIRATLNDTNLSPTQS